MFAQLGVQGARVSSGLPGLVAAVEVVVVDPCYSSYVQGTQPISWISVYADVDTQ